MTRSVAWMVSSIVSRISCDPLLLPQRRHPDWPPKCLGRLYVLRCPREFVVPVATAMSVAEPNWFDSDREVT